jgi:hypothetical protein
MYMMKNVVFNMCTYMMCMKSKKIINKFKFIETDNRFFLEFIRGQLRKSKNLYFSTDFFVQNQFLFSVFICRMNQE